MPRLFYRSGMKAGQSRQIAWYLRQLLPLMYFTEYKENGQKKVSVWRQWFGRVLWQKNFKVC